MSLPLNTREFTMLYRSFVNLKTVSKNKIDYEAKLVDMFQKLEKPLKGTSVVTLVGHPSGLLRHINLFKNHFESIYVVERCPKLFKRLDKKLASLKLQKQNVYIIHGDFFDIVDRLNKANIKIGCLDFDGVEIIGKNERKLYKLSKQCKAIVTINVGSARGQSKEFKEWCKLQGKRRTAYQHGLRYELKRVAPEYIKKIGKSYVHDFTTYQGVSNMYRCISIASQYGKAA